MKATTYSDTIREALAEAERFADRARHYLSAEAEFEAHDKARSGSAAWNAGASRWEAFHAAEPERREARHAALERARLDTARALRILGRAGRRSR